MLPNFIKFLQALEHHYFIRFQGFFDHIEVQRIRLGFEIPGVAERCAETLVVHTAEGDLPAVNAVETFLKRNERNSLLN